jgi:hypothetical protein
MPKQIDDHATGDSSDDKFLKYVEYFMHWWPKNHDMSIFLIVYHNSTSPTGIYLSRVNTFITQFLIFQNFLVALLLQ